MTDFTKSTGSTGTMMIRDTGTYVEFWLKAGAGSYNYDLPWGYTINGSTDNTKQFRFESGGSWQLLGRWNVTSDQTAYFRLGDSGVSGIGGPTTLSAFIDRSNVPDPPSAISFSSLTSTSVVASFSDGNNNGAAIDTRQIGYGRSSSYPDFFVTSDKSTLIGNLASGVRWFFWARTHNAKGWSSWGPRRDITTYKVPDAPDPVVLTNATQTSVEAFFTGNGEGGLPILEWQLSFGTHPTISQFSVTYQGKTTVDGLNPGKTYYFWARGRNSAGWGPYSPVRSVTLLAGVRILVGSTWKRAVPYVKVAGVWKVAEAWGKSAGYWSKSV